MSNVRRISQMRMRQAVHERETLTPCPACCGRGFKMTETATSYSKIWCRWCEGLGATSKGVVAMFNRAKRISGMFRRVA